MFIKAGQYDGTSDDLYSEIVRNCQAIDRPFLKKKNDSKNSIVLYTWNDIMCPFWMKARWQSDTAIWKVTQDSLNPDHTYGLTFKNRKAPKHPVLSMTYQQIGQNILVMSKTGGTRNHLQKTACVQAGIHIKTSQAYACCHDKQSEGVVQQLGQYQLLESYIDLLKQDDLGGSFMFESVQGISGHTNKPGLTVVKWLCVESSATKKAWDGILQIMVVDRTFLKGHIFDQVILCAVTYGRNNN